MTGLGSDYRKAKETGRLHWDKETCAEQNYRNWDVGRVTDVCRMERKLECRSDCTAAMRTALCECEWKKWVDEAMWLLRCLRLWEDWWPCFVFYDIIGSRETAGACACARRPAVSTHACWLVWQCFWLFTSAMFYGNGSVLAKRDESKSGLELNLQTQQPV